MTAPTDGRIPTDGGTRAAARRIAVVWLFLSGATALSWWLGIERALSNRRAVSVTIVAIAMFKVRVVIRYFMNVKAAPRALQIACDVWVLSLGTAMVYLYGMGSR